MVKNYISSLVAAATAGVLAFSTPSTSYSQSDNAGPTQEYINKLAGITQTTPSSQVPTAVESVRANEPKTPVDIRKTSEYLALQRDYQQAQNTARNLAATNSELQESVTELENENTNLEGRLNVTESKLERESQLRQQFQTAYTQRVDETRLPGDVDSMYEAMIVSMKDMLEAFVSGAGGKEKRHYSYGKGYELDERSPIGKFLTALFAPGKDPKFKQVEMYGHIPKTAIQIPEATPYETESRFETIDALVDWINSARTIASYVELDYQDLGTGSVEENRNLLDEAATTDLLFRAAHAFADTTNGSNTLLNTYGTNDPAHLIANPKFEDDALVALEQILGEIQASPEFGNSNAFEVFFELGVQYMVSQSFNQSDFNGDGIPDTHVIAIKDRTPGQHGQHDYMTIAEPTNMGVTEIDSLGDENPNAFTKRESRRLQRDPRREQDELQDQKRSGPFFFGRHRGGAGGFRR